MKGINRVWTTPLLVGSLIFAFVCAMDDPAFAGSYTVTKLVSDIAGAQQTDPNLVNPWGISSSPTSPFWISDNGTGLASVYVTDGTTVTNPLVVTIPPPPGSPAGTVAAPTGNVFNGSGGFMVTNGTASGSSLFLFATEDGTISGWSPSVVQTQAFIAVDNSAVDPADRQHRSAVYKGLAIATTATGTFIYASNFRGGFVEMYDSDFTLVKTFTDHTLANSYAPFGIQTVGDRLFVTYAKLDSKKHDDVSGLGHGFIDVFDLQGNLISRFASHGTLNSPWGIVLAPAANFGTFSGALLVGNFGDGRINAFNPATGDFLGQLADAAGNPVTISGLWGLRFGNGAMAGPPTTLFFTAGIDGEAHGLFGSITAQ
jgi:uncharacterized protein (TIGR03118 family)